MVVNMKRAATVKSELVCSICGNIMPISRKIAHQRNKYHVKDIYCYKCDIITKHIELHNSDILKKELEFNQNRSEIEELIYNLLNKENYLKTKMLFKR